MLGIAGVGVGVLWLLRRSGAADLPLPITPKPPGEETSRLLDNFEQRFAELKTRRPDGKVLGDLYALADQLEKRGRLPQATAVFRHLDRLDNTYRDTAVRLGRLLDAERRVPAPPKPATPSPARQVSAATATAVAAAVGETMPIGNLAQAPSRAQAEMLRPELERLGRYELRKEIGRGAMGVVYLGRDSAINREVAIKVIPLNSELSESEIAEARMRFFREAETAGRLSHPNIVTIYDVGEERGLAYIAMEYLKGRHLSDHASSARLLEPIKVLDLIGRTAEALGFAHKQQVVHRDIKPANLMYEPGTDTLKITDFGIARITGLGNTRTGIVLGTPSFMSPEQLEGQTVTGRSDLFSLGVSLYQLLTGQLPFQADSMTGLMQQIAESPHPPLRAMRPDLPSCVDAVIDRALAKDPNMRFDTGAQMAAALDDCRKRMASEMTSTPE
ncbi:MAG: serine/threonine-protein kinase [Steroidobacterales bacterium]